MVGFLVLVQLAGPGRAAVWPDTADATVTHFARCTGQLSALMEHQWMTDGPGSEVTQARRAYFVSLLEAAMPDAVSLDARDVLHLRIEAKMAYARLLQQATFAQDNRTARFAERNARLLMAHCDGLMLG